MGPWRDTYAGGDANWGKRKVRAVRVLMVGGATVPPSACCVTDGTRSTGFWGRSGLARAARHHRARGGDWATDFYAPPATPGVSSPSAPSGAWGVVTQVAGSCRDSRYRAGYVIVVDVRDDEGSRGWVAYAYVQDTWGVSGTGRASVESSRPARGSDGPTGGRGLLTTRSATMPASTGASRCGRWREIRLPIPATIRTTLAKVWPMTRPLGESA